MWGGAVFVANSGQVRCIVAARTKKRAVELMLSVTRYFSMGQLNKYCSETGNAFELATATEEGVWKQVDGFNKPYERLK